MSSICSAVVLTGSDAEPGQSPFHATDEQRLTAESGALRHSSIMLHSFSRACFEKRPPFCRGSLRSSDYHNKKMPVFPEQPFIYHRFPCLLEMRFFRNIVRYYGHPKS
jgi:hypothetical protein